MERAKKIIRVLLLAGLGGVFAFAGIVKAAAPATFATAIDHYHLLPWPVVVLVALYLPWLEIVCALALALPGLRAAALWLVLGMTLVFLGALLSAAARGLDVECGCFGGGGGHPLAAAGRDLVIFVVVLVCLRGERKVRTAA